MRMTLPVTIRGGVGAGPASPAVESGMQVMPGLDLHVAVAAVGDGEVGVGGGPGDGLGECEAVPVAARPSPLALGSGCGLGVEHPLGADPHEDLGSGVGQSVAERGRVVSGVEDEHRDVCLGGEQPHEAADLVERDVGGVVARRDARDVNGGGP